MPKYAQLYYFGRAYSKNDDKWYDSIEDRVCFN